MRPALTAELAQKLVAITMMSCAHFAKSVDLSSPVPAPPGTVVRSVEVYPNANKNKAFPLPEGSGMCVLGDGS